jgi:hypothetical protein
MIGERTRLALAAKKAHGAPLGNRTNVAEAQTMGAAANRQAADAFAPNVLPVLRELQAQRHHDGAGDCRGAERSGHSHGTRRGVASLDCAEPAGTGGAYRPAAPRRPCSGGSGILAASVLRYGGASIGER